MNINSLIKQGSEILKKKNINSHQIDAELLLSKTIKKNRSFLFTNDESKVSSKTIFNYLNFILRRKQYEPLSYITQTKEFWSLCFDVNHNVLIPRPETEIIVEQVIRKFRLKNSINILDIGTGSGCILLSILSELKNSQGTGIDKSSRAIDIAKKNSKKLKLLKRAKFIHRDVDNYDIGNYDVIVSNPPYICSNGINYLSEDIKGFEPRMALDGGNSGVEIINKVILKAKKLLKNGGSLFIEIGNDQFCAVSSILVTNGFRLVKKFFDNRKTVRCIMSTKLI